MAGRPSKLTPEVTALVLEALRAGNYRNVAADYAGIGWSTMRDWLARGKKHPTSEFGNFRRQVIEAEKKAEMRMVALVMKAASEDARHAQWFLERKFNSRWGRKERHELTGKQGAPIQSQTKVEVESADPRERYTSILSILESTGAVAADQPDSEAGAPAGAEDDEVRTAPPSPAPGGVPSPE